MEEKYFFRFFKTKNRCHFVQQDEVSEIPFTNYWVG